MFSYGISPVAEETRKIRRAANCIGAAYAFIFVFDLLLEYLVGYSFSFSRFIFKVINDPVYKELFQITFSLLVFVPPYIMAVGLSGRRFSIIDFRRPRSGSSFSLVLMGLGICQIGEIAATMFGNVLSSIGHAPVMPEVTYSRGFYGVALAVISTAFVPALAEEFAMRGVAMGLLRRFGDGFAILMSSIMFGLMHRNLVQAPFAFIVGLGLGFVAVKGGSVWLAVIVHFINNLLAVCFTYLTKNLTTTMKSAVFCSYAAVMLAVGVIGFCLCKQKDELFTFEAPKTECSLLRKTAAFFTSPLIIIGLLLTANDIFNLQVF